MQDGALHPVCFNVLQQAWGADPTLWNGGFTGGRKVGPMHPDVERALSLVPGNVFWLAGHSLAEQRPCYAEWNDKLWVPRPSRFKDPQTFVQVLFHETIHRAAAHVGLYQELPFETSTNNPNYDRHEIIAELGSLHLYNHFGFYGYDTMRSAQYLVMYHWYAYESEFSSLARGILRCVDWVLRETERHAPVMHYEQPEVTVPHSRLPLPRDYN